jgi:hypothetical protein
LLEKKELNPVYPNPSSESISISGEDLENDNYTISLYDIVGRKVKSENYIVADNSISTNIEVRGLQAGIYYLSVVSSKYKKTIKIVRE